MQKGRQDWVEILQAMIDSYRVTHPEDQRDDRQLAKSIMDFMVSSGVVEVKNGKYIVPNVDDPKALIAMVKGPIVN